MSAPTSSGDPWKLLRAAAAGWIKHEAQSLAAALAYYAAFSLAPLLIVAISIASAVFDEAATREAVHRQIADAAGPQAAELIENMMSSSRHSGMNGLMGVVGAVTLLITAGGVFGQLKDSLNRIWEAEPRPGNGVVAFLRDRFISVGMVLGCGFLMIVSLIASTLLTAMIHSVGQLLPVSPIILQLANLTLSLAVFTGVFAMIFRMLPDVPVRWREVGTGALLTALLFTIGKTALSLYLGRDSVASTYGAAGALMLVLLWVHYSALILLFGAEFTAADARRLRGESQ